MTGDPSAAHGAACGKVILFGEHAVVHGVPAIAAGIDRGAEANARRAEGASSLVLGARRVTVGDDDDLARALGALLAEGSAAPAVAVEVHTDLPPGGGLGCSAALGMAIGRAVARLAGEDDEQAQARGLAWEKVFHGNPSGVDTAAAALGGCLRFVRGGEVSRIAPARDLWLAVGSTGQPSSTKTMVESVARLRERQPEAFERTLGAFRSLVDNAKLAIEAGDVRTVGSLFDLAQMLLSGWMLSTEAIERLCSIARGSGALGAKLTGAGGGGCVIALVDDTLPEGGEAAAGRVVAAWRDAGFTGFTARIARHGGRA